MTTRGLIEEPEGRELVHREFSAQPTRALPAMEASMISAQDYVSLATYWHTLMKRRWTIATVAIVITVLAAIISFRMEPSLRLRLGCR